MMGCCGLRLVAILHLAGCAYGLRCYFGLGDPFAADTSLVRTTMPGSIGGPPAPEPCSVCAKLDAQAAVVARSCLGASDDPGRTGCYQTSASMTQCFCRTDLCNGGPGRWLRWQAVVTVAGVLAVVTFVFRFTVQN